MNRAICIHGHIYQPPRENPWLGEVWVQRSAAPFHDWNERVTAECYAPNTAARILDEEGMIEDVMNIYSKVSFTAAPTLLSWLRRHRPQVYDAIICADRESQRHYSGHGSAIASCYNHLIMPLASREDKETQIIWGIRDFIFRFGRMPEGMWLPETAVDVESLDLMARAGIKYTILAPHQARRVRAGGEEDWIDVSDSRVDTRMPYLCRLPSGRSISIFFYNGKVAREVAFSDLLADGKRFARRLFESFSLDGKDPEIVHIATDGETYGHHRKFGEMALAYCLRTIEAQRDVCLTVYGEYLAFHSPTHEVMIHERTSWSCAHGIERWQRGCGCHSGAHPEWTQAWREPLREGIVMVRDTLTPKSLERLSIFLQDPLRARNDAIDLVLSGWSEEVVDEFLSRHARRNLTTGEREQVLALLEMERQMMLMQTSCGWFFDDITELGSIQVIRHAGRAMDLARQVLDLDVEPAFIGILSRAPVNEPGYATGASVYDAYVRPAAMDLARIGAGSALYDLFGLEAPAMYDAEYDWLHKLEDSDRCGRVGMVKLRSRVTGEEVVYDLIVLFSGMDQISLGVRLAGDGEPIETVWEKAIDSGTIEGFSQIYTASDLSDEERWAVSHRVFPEIDKRISSIYQDTRALIDVIEDLGIPKSGSITRLLEHACNEHLKMIFEVGSPEPERFNHIIERMKEEGLRPDRAMLGDVVSRRIADMVKGAQARPDDPGPLEAVNRIVLSAGRLMLPLSLWEGQNAVIEMRKRYDVMRRRADKGDEGAERWVGAFEETATHLGVKVT